MRLNDLLSVGNLFLKLGDKMKSYLKTTAGFVLSATMATASYGATVSGLQEKFLLGQSSALLHVGGFAAGLSTQNLWWGPGQYSSLLLSIFNNQLHQPSYK